MKRKRRTAASTLPWVCPCLRWSSSRLLSLVGALWCLSFVGMFIIFREMVPALTSRLPDDADFDFYSVPAAVARQAVEQGSAARGTIEASQSTSSSSPSHSSALSPAAGVRSAAITSDVMAETTLTWKGFLSPRVNAFSCSKKLERHDALSILPRDRLRIFGRGASAGVVFSIGMSSVARKKEYLTKTIQGMLDSDPQAVSRLVLVVHLADFDPAWLETTSAALQRRFESLVASGRFHGIHLPEGCYPTFDICPPKCHSNDSPNRTRWRSKQNTDYAVLMHYAAPFAPYYIQAEDDLVFAPQWSFRVEMFLKSAQASFPTWRVVDFSELGFIGKMFRGSEVAHMAQHLLRCYDELPCDLLLGQWMKTSRDERHNGCIYPAEAPDVGLRLAYWKNEPSLFQHVGVFRTLGGFQPIEEKHFGKLLFNNPPAALFTSFALEPTFESRFAYFPGGEPSPRDDRCNFALAAMFQQRKYKRCWLWAHNVAASQHLTLVFARSLVLKAVYIEFGIMDTFGLTGYPNDLLQKGAVEVADRNDRYGAGDLLSCGTFQLLLEVNSDKAVYWEEGEGASSTLPMERVQCLRLVALAAQPGGVVVSQIYIRSSDA